MKAVIQRLPGACGSMLPDYKHGTPACSAPLHSHNTDADDEAEAPPTKVNLNDRPDHGNGASTGQFVEPYWVAWKKRATLNVCNPHRISGAWFSVPLPV